MNNPIGRRTSLTWPVFRPTSRLWLGRLRWACLVLCVAPLWPAHGQTLGFGNFQPTAGSLQTLSVTSASSSATWVAGTPSGSNSVADTDIYIYNAGTALAFCRWGLGAQTALVTDTPIPSGTVQVFSKIGADTLACITAASTATVRAVTGSGR